MNSLLLLLLALHTPQLATGGGPVHIVEPVLTADGAPVLLDAPDGRRAPLVVPAPPGELREALDAVLRDEYARRLLRLQRQASQHYGRTQGAWLLLSTEDGGFAREGLWVETPNGPVYEDVLYVNLVVDKESVESGHFEEIWAHETAHVLLRMATGGLQGRSNKMHQSMTLTDHVTAVDEGLAIALQPLTRRHSRNERLRLENEGLTNADYVDFWLSRQDRSLRSHGVRQNLFVHPRIESADSLPLVERYRLMETATAFDRRRLRTGSQLFASEGFMATVFYRLLQHPDIGARGAPAPVLWNGWPTALWKLLDAAHVASRGDPDRPLGARILDAWVTLYPEDAADVIDVFLGASFGATVDPLAHEYFESVAGPGTHGDIEGIVSALPRARRFLADLNERLLDRHLTFDSAAGPSIWVTSDDFLIGEAMWSQEPTRPLRVDLNTATTVEFETLPGFDRDLARRAAVLRRQGDFRSIADFCRRLSLAPGTCLGLQESSELATSNIRESR